MSNPGYCPSCKESGWACRCGREPLPASTITGGVEALSERIMDLLHDEGFEFSPVQEERLSEKIYEALSRPQPEGVEASNE